MEEGKTYKIQFYTSPWFGHSIPLAKFAELVAKNLPNMNVKFIAFEYLREKLSKDFKTVNFEFLYPDHTLEYQEYLNNKVQTPKRLQIIFKMFQDYLQKKTEFPDLIITDFLAVTAMKFAKKKGIPLIVNFPNSPETLRPILNFMTTERSYSIEGFLINYQLPKIKQFIYFDEMLDSIRNHGRVVFQTFLGLEQADILPPNYSFVGLLPNRSNSELTPELKEWIEGWKNKGKNKFLYISFGTILCLSHNLAKKLAAMCLKLGYPTIWSLRCKESQEIQDPLIFHREWLPQEAILRLPQVRGYVSHCGWGSITEAIISKTPLICVPAFIDQPINAKIVTKKNIGVVVYDTVNFEIPEVFDIELSEERFVNGVTAVFEDDVYQRSIERLNKMSTLHDATRNICNIVIESLEFGNGHLLNQQVQNATIKTGVPLSQILKPEYLPPNAP